MKMGYCDEALTHGEIAELRDQDDASDAATQLIQRAEVTCLLQPKANRFIHFLWAPTALLETQTCEYKQRNGHFWFTGDSEIKADQRTTLGKTIASVNGAERFKFFKYMPKSFTSWLDVHQKSFSICIRHPQSDKAAGEIPALTQVERLGELEYFGKDSKPTQSSTREQDIQADPYSPEYVCSYDDRPDELALSHFCWANGLPATSGEIRVIKEMQVQRRLEQLLPPPTDEFCLEIRTALMERQEFFKWAQRERDIRELQERRLKLIEIALKLRATKVRAKRDVALRRRQKVIKEQTQRRELLIERRRLENIRRLWRQRNEIVQSVSKSLCAANKLRSARCFPLVVPPKRDGRRHPDIFTLFSADHLAHTKDFVALDIMEKRLCNSVASTVANVTPTLGPRKTYASARKDKTLSKALEHAATILQQEVAAELLTGTSLQLQIDLAAAPQAHSASEGGSVAARRLLKRNIRTRPETPRVNEESLEEEQETMAIMLLQQLLRGTARRLLMVKGKEKSLDLVAMLRAAEQMQDVSPQKQQEAVDRQTALESAEILLASAQGVAIAEVLDELAKEQRRMEEVQRISALAYLAVRERRLREAQESGTRQAEETLRERENEAFRTAMSIHNQTIDSYLQAIIDKAGAGNAQKEALVEVRLHAEHVAEVVDNVQEQHEVPETTVESLIKGFLMPRLASQCHKRDEQLETHKFRVASRLGVEEAVSSALTSMIKQSAQMPNASDKVLQAYHKLGYS